MVEQDTARTGQQLRAPAQSGMVQNDCVPVGGPVFRQRPAAIRRARMHAAGEQRGRMAGPAQTAFDTPRLAGNRIMKTKIGYELTEAHKQRQRPARSWRRRVTMVSRERITSAVSACR